MDNRIKSYKELIVWQKAISLVSDVYAISKTFPNEEKFGLVNQLNRAVVSIPSNITLQKVGGENRQKTIYNF